MNILVTGANGQLGNEMRILAKGSTDRYIFTDVSQAEGVETVYLDITDPDAVRRAVADNHVDAIVNCAAYTNVDAAETNLALAEKLNADAPENLALAMKETGGLLIHISTDYVFGGESYNTPCREDMTGTPTGVYGMTKLRGEQKVIATGCSHVIIRTAWLYSEFGKNFCKTMMNLTATKAELNVVFDQVGTPTYALDLAKAIAVVLKDYAASHPGTTGQAGGDGVRLNGGAAALVNGGAAALVNGGDGVRLNGGAVMPDPDRASYAKSGIYHYSNEGVCSWYDFTKMIAEYNGTTSCDIRPCHSNEFPSPVRRPSYSVLDKTKIKETFGIRVPYWTDSLKECLSNMKDSTLAI